MPRGCRYGPFWIATTLIFVTAAAGNFSSYIAWKQQHEGEAESGVNPGQWFADTTKVRDACEIGRGTWQSIEPGRYRKR